jgi:hypothetical protein
MYVAASPRFERTEERVVACRRQEHHVVADRSLPRVDPIGVLVGEVQLRPVLVGGVGVVLQLDNEQILRVGELEEQVRVLATVRTADEAALAAAEASRYAVAAALVSGSFLVSRARTGGTLTVEEP